MHERNRAGTAGAARRRIGSRALVLFILLAMPWAAGCRRPDVEKAPAPSRVVSVAAASDLRYALPGLIARFRQDHPEISIEPTFGSSGNFVAQISNGASFDLFFSADVSYPTRLVEKGLADGATLSLYGIGRLVLWVPKGSTIDVNRFEVVREESVRKIAIANPRHAPYGRAAEAALAHFGWLEEVREKLVLAENVSQAAQLVQSSAADCGLIAYALAIAPPMADQGRFLLVPTEAYPPLEQASILLHRSKSKEDALAFQQFVASETGRAILKQFGFEPPSAPASSEPRQ